VYLENFGLKEFPFQQRFDDRFIYFSRSHEECLTRLLYTVNENKEAALITGMHGTGKSLLLSVFKDNLQKSGYQVIEVMNANLPPEQFLEEVLWELGQRREGRNKIEMLHMLHDIMKANAEKDQEIVLVVDEVQYVTDPATFMEMHQLLNIRFNGKCPLTLILCGAHDFDKNSEIMGPLADRLVIHSKLDILNLTDTGQYLGQRLRVAGLKQQLFDQGAIDILHKTTHGIPRNINHLADLSLLIAASEGRAQIDGQIVQMAANEWQGLE
jgi:general secretion pathway protein A